MVHLPLSVASIETPIELIFEKVMLRKMTEQEKEVLHLNGHVKPSRKHSSHGARISHKNGSRLAAKIAAKLTSI
jgi:hypothetical protein